MKGLKSIAREGSVEGNIEQGHLGRSFVGFLVAWLPCLEAELQVVYNDMKAKLADLSQETAVAASHCESMAVIVRDRMQAITAMLSPTMDALKGYIKKFESVLGDFIGFLSIF
eukprot:4389490-Amphidinium_carterae.1